MQQPEPQGRQFATLIGSIEQGQVKIPQFQRDFVWTKEKSAHLLDSIFRGYPVGTFILWKTKESLRSVRNLGEAELPEVPPGDFVQYVLDGQQRLTSLYASVRGLKKVRRDERVDDFSEMYIDLAANPDEQDQQIVVVNADGRDPSSLIKIVDLLTGGLRFLNTFPEKYHDALDEYKERLQSYSFSVILVDQASIEVATEIFTRINVSGKPLSVFEIMVAKTFDADRDFDLAEEFDQLIEELPGGYETIPSAVVLQTISAILTKECNKKDILRLKKSEFIDAWPDTVEAIRSAVDYLRTFYRIPVSRLLPYAALLVPFSYFFYYHPDRPAGDKERYLQDLFWRVSLSGRYSSSLETKLAQDIRRVDAILGGEQPAYDYAVDTSPEFIRDNGWFGTGRSFVKAFLCLLAHQQPESFDNGGSVNMRNDWLKQANSKNYHHFFPKAYMKKKQGKEDWRVNHIANITVVDDFLNKRKIRDKPPATYMREFKNSNPNLDETMKTHLIDLAQFGVWSNNFEKFFWERCKAISQELEKRVIVQPVDARGQAVHTDDFESVELEQTAV